MNTMTAPSTPVSPVSQRKLDYGVFDIEIHCSPPSADAIAKYLPCRYRERFSRRGVFSSFFNVDQRGGNNRYDVDCSDGGPPASNPALIRKQLLDPYQIEWAICTGLYYNLSVIPDVDYASAIASAFNRWLIEEFIGGDPALFGVVCVVLQNPAKAIEEIERWGSHPKVAEVLISTAGRELLGHRSFHPVYEAAAAHRLPVAAHTTVEGRGISGPPSSAGYPSRYLEFHTSLAGSAIANTASLVCEGAFAKYPDFRFVLLEGGISWAQPLMWALDAEWKRLREEMPQLKELPSEYLKRQMYYTTQPIEEPGRPRDLIETYRQIHGETQIMFSSDYPHWDFDNPYLILPGQASAALKRRILRDNALALYGPRLVPSNR